MVRLRLESGDVVDREVEDHGNAVAVLPFAPVRRRLGFERCANSARPQEQEIALADVGSALLMVGLTVAACLAFDFNPRVAYYLPLLPSVFICALLFGFGASLFAVIASIAAADFFFAPPVFDFQITEWEDVLGLAAFGIIGALVALAPGSTSS